MGHSTVLTTEQYAHLRADLAGAAELGREKVDLTAVSRPGDPYAGKAPGPEVDGADERANSYRIVDGAAEQAPDRV